MDSLLGQDVFIVRFSQQSSYFDQVVEETGVLTLVLQLFVFKRESFC